MKLHPKFFQLSVLAVLGVGVVSALSLGSNQRLQGQTGSECLRAVSQGGTCNTAAGETPTPGFLYDQNGACAAEGAALVIPARCVTAETELMAFALRAHVPCVITQEEPEEILQLLVATMVIRAPMAVNPNVWMMETASVKTYVKWGTVSTASVTLMPKIATTMMNVRWTPAILLKGVCTTKTLHAKTFRRQITVRRDLRKSPDL